ncbi:MAG: hypothetical protein PWP14_1747 [Methanolobus sp.]|nr:hypothetical protein [Methanolobus sp.]
MIFGSNIILCQVAAFELKHTVNPVYFQTRINTDLHGSYVVGISKPILQKSVFIRVNPCLFRIMVYWFPDLFFRHGLSLIYTDLVWQGFLNPLFLESVFICVNQCLKEDYEKHKYECITIRFLNLKYNLMPFVGKLHQKRHNYTHRYLKKERFR